jgi:hypothetical protein
MALVQKGNAKLGRGVYATSLKAGEACPGASAFCLGRPAAGGVPGSGEGAGGECYAVAIQRRRPNVMASWSNNLRLLQDSPAEYWAQMASELGRLKAGSVVRVHVSGDMVSAVQVMGWCQMAGANPGLTFYLYTRSYAAGDLGLLAALAILEAKPNVWVWYSSDPTMDSPIPDNGREARVFRSEGEAREAGYAVCPEQLGRKASCSDCGLYWKAGPGFKLAFVEHKGLVPMAERHAAAERKG